MKIKHHCQQIIKRQRTGIRRSYLFFELTEHYVWLKTTPRIQATVDLHRALIAHRKVR